MIEFKGDLTGASQEYALKKTAKLTQRFLLLCSVCLLPCSYIISVTFLHNFWIFILPALFLVASIIPRIAYKKYAHQLPRCICIDSDTIAVDFKFNSQSLNTDAVKAVYDYGEFYEIISKINIGLSPVIICQKDLLTDGTLEEFEKMFDNKIVRSKKHD